MPLSNQIQPLKPNIFVSTTDADLAPNTMHLNIQYYKDIPDT